MTTEADEEAVPARKSEQRDLIKAVVLLVIIAGLYVGAWIFSTDGGRAQWSPYWFSSMIGISVGVTELIARYRDAPFAPLVTIPGLIYLGINGAAAWLAYHFIVEFRIPIESDTGRVLTAGIAAMALFRSGVFTARLGDSDVAIGPNIILEIFLAALDRTYDRMRAEPRSRVVARLMCDLSFTETSQSLPAMCFNLMQNVSEAEKTAIGREVEELADSAMSDEAKSMNLGLALFNLVGERTLEAAVSALGNTVKGFKQLSDEMLQTAAKIDPDVIVTVLPQMCNELAAEDRALEDPATLTKAISAQQLAAEAKAVLVLYKLVRHYGETTVLRVLVAMS